MTVSQLLSALDASATATVAMGIPTLLLLWKYTAETIKLRKIAEQQQEAQTSPVLVLSIEPHSLAGRHIEVKNVSAHPAFNVQMDPVPISGAAAAIFLGMPYFGGRRIADNRSAIQQISS